MSKQLILCEKHAGGSEVFWVVGNAPTYTPNIYEKKENCIYCKHEALEKRIEKLEQIQDDKK